MAFQPEMSVSANPDWPEASEKKTLDFLRPGKALDGLRATDPSSAEKVEDEARKKTLRALNALRIVGPLLAAIQERGVAGSDEEFAREFMGLIASTTDFSQKMAEVLNIDPQQPKNFWIRNVLERICAEAIKERWLVHGDSDVRRLVLAASLAAASENIENGGTEFSAINSDTTVRIAMIKAMGLVISSLENGFDFFRNLDSETERIGRLLLDVAGKGTVALSDVNAGERERASLFSVLVEEAARLYGASWKVVGRRAIDDLDAISDEELERLLSTHKNGLPVHKVDEGFQKNFKRLLAVTEKLIPSNPGGISERVRSKR